MKEQVTVRVSKHPTTGEYDVRVRKVIHTDYDSIQRTLLDTKGNWIPMPSGYPFPEDTALPLDQDMILMLATDEEEAEYEKKTSTKAKLEGSDSQPKDNQEKGIQQQQKHYDSDKSQSKEESKDSQGREDNRKGGINYEG